MSAREGMSFKGCTSRAEALARFESWLDTYLAEEVRIVAADMSAQDGHECDVTAFLSEVAQVRHWFERSRGECRAQFAQALDAMFGPDREGGDR